MSIKERLADSAKMVKNYFVRAYSSFVANVFDVPPRLLALLCLLVLLAIPVCWTNSWVNSGKYLQGVFTIAAIYAILGASWDLLVGRTGQVSLGHAFFYGGGAYVSGIIYENILGKSDWATIPMFAIPVLFILAIGVLLIVLRGFRRAIRKFLILAIFAIAIGVTLIALSFFAVLGFWLPISTAWITVPIAIAVAVLFAVFLGLPALRVKGPYLGLLTMCIPLIGTEVVMWEIFGWLFHGEMGVSITPFYGFPSGTSGVIRTAVNYYFSLTLLFFSAIILYKIASSKTGIVFVSILDNELASKACGINVTRYKLLSFAISGLFGALAGCLCTHLMSRKVIPDNLSLTYSFLPMIVTFLGGLGTIYGPIAGAYIYQISSSILREHILPKYIIPWLAVFRITLPSFEVTQQILFSAIIIIIVIKFPRGIARIVVDKLNDLAKPRDIEERGARIWKKYKKERKESRLRKIFSRFKKKQKEMEVKT